MNIGKSGVLMIDVVRQLRSYVESENREYSISFEYKDAKELLKYIHRLEVQNFKLDSALDKACAKLEHLDYYMNLDDCYTQDDWKEWALQDE